MSDDEYWYDVAQDRSKQVTAAEAALAAEQERSGALAEALRDLISEAESVMWDIDNAPHRTDSGHLSARVGVAAAALAAYDAASAVTAHPQEEDDRG